MSADEYPEHEYAELIVNAKGALRELLMASEPGTGLKLHDAYNVLKSMEEKATAPSASREPNADSDRRSWNRRPLSERERDTLDALANDHLTSGQLAERILGGGCYKAWLQPVLKSLREGGKVGREEIPGYRGGPRPKWLYFRTAELSGPIADLDRALGDTPEVA